MTLVDTDILIDAGRGEADALHCLQSLQNSGGAAISVVTQMELLVGCRNKSESQKLAKFLRRFGVVKLNEAISDESLSLLRTYRLSHGLLIADSLIAATALTLKVPLLNLLPYP